MTIEGPTHRFQLTKFAGGVAFDTQTGQICRTWDWEPSGKPSDTGAQRSFGEYAPTCLDLYNRFPTSVLQGGVSVLDGDNGS